MEATRRRKARSAASTPAPEGLDLGPGWAERVAHPPGAANEQRGPFKARRRADYHAMVRRASTRGHASKRLDRAFADLPPEVDEVDE